MCRGRLISKECACGLLVLRSELWVGLRLVLLRFDLFQGCLLSAGQRNCLGSHFRKRPVLGGAVEQMYGAIVCRLRNNIDLDTFGVDATPGPGGNAETTGNPR